MIKPMMPSFVFARCPDVEHEGGFLLAGILVVDLPAADRRKMRVIEDIVEELAERAQSGVLGDELTVGWRGDREPENAINQYDDLTLAAWARGCLKIVVRVDPDTDGEVQAERLYH